jgi:ribosome-associated protein
MDIRKLQRVIVDGLEDVKGQNIVVFNTEHLSSLFERVIIASGTSNRQTRSLASSVREAVKKAGFPVPRLEGEDNGEWIIVDCGAAVTHVMQPAIRDYYHLEEIWGDKPVKIKVDGAPTKLVKASEPEPAAQRTGAAKKAVSRTAGTKKAGAEPVAAKRGGARSAAGKPAHAKPVTARPTVAKKSAAGKAPAKKLPAKKTSAARTPTRAPGKAPASKVVTRVVGVKRAAPGSSSATKKTAAKKSPARKTASRG